MSNMFNVISEYCARNRDEVFKKYMESRHWSDETVQKWELGYFPQNDILSLKVLARKHGITEDELAIKGVARKNKSVFFNRIVFPIKNVWGETIAITGRTLSGDVKPKYYNTIFEKGKNLFGLNLAIDEALATKRVYVFEGNADVITAHQFGIENSVCVMGTTFSEDHLILLSRYAKEVVLMFDNDDGGKKALASFNKKKLDDSRKEIKIYRAKVSDSKDVDEYLNKFGKDSLLELVEKTTKDINLQKRFKSVI